MTYHQSRMSLRAQLIESLSMPLTWHFPQGYPDHREPALKSALKLKPARAHLFDRGHLATHQIPYAPYDIKC